jgi:UDP-N-acetylmuramoyl-L-alanyl-D-glutamate--2,6-diaminopimelate ligase
MLLKDLLKNVKVTGISGRDDVDIKGISINSKKIKKGFLFCAIPGFRKDGHDFIEEAVKNGAVAVMVQNIVPKNVYEKGKGKITEILVENTRKELPLVSRNFYENPASGLFLCGVTGTNGKTTTVFLANAIFKASGIKTSYITTIRAEAGSRKLQFDRTTPESLELNDFFAKSVKEGIKASFMEVSSHSIDLHRVSFIDFNCFAFTNLTQDHLDYHETMENYFEVKSRLFSAGYRGLFNPEYAVINIDDLYGRKIFENTCLFPITYSIKNPDANLVAHNISSSIDGIKMDVEIKNISDKANISFKNIKSISIKSALCGDFNVYNILAAVGIGIFGGIKPGDIVEGINSMEGVPGRFEKVKTQGRNVIVDYAHTPDGLENVLKTAKSLLEPGAKLICVFGCGGDRDRKKRRIMGEIAANLADYCIITSDNPRSEDPAEIIGMIEEGFTFKNLRNYIKEPDRKIAIYRALDVATENDIIMIAGKGHEDYQEFADRKIHFSDQEVVLNWSGKS